MPSPFSPVARRVAVVLLSVLGLSGCQGKEPVSPSPADLSPIVLDTVDTSALAPTAVLSATNLIANGTFDAGGINTPTGWTSATRGSFVPGFTYPATGRSGRGAAVTRLLASNGEARWQPAQVTVTPGARYLYGIWYRSNAAAVVWAEFADSAGAKSYGRIGTLPASPNGWTQFRVPLTVPATRVTASVFVGLVTAGWVSVDDASLVAATLPAPPAPAPTVTLTASQSSVVAGDSVTLTWTSVNATSCAASGAWTGARAIGGSAVVRPAATGTYTLACSGAGGDTAQSVVITVTAAPPPPPPPGAFAEGIVSLAFNSAWESQHVNALPVLEAAALKATFYMPARPIEQGWSLFMTPAMVLDIAAKGHEIGGQTFGFVDLTTLSTDSARSEIVRGNTYLQTLTSRTPTSFAYPYGASNAAVRTLVQSVGFTSGLTVFGGQANLTTTPPYELFSMCVDPGNDLPAMKAAVDSAIVNKRWLILCFFDVKTGGDNTAITPAAFQELVAYIKSRSIRVVTVAQGRALMAP